MASKPELKTQPEQAVATPLAHSIADAANISSIGRTMIYDLIAAGDLRARKVGSKTLILHEDLLAFLRDLPAMKTDEAA
jgi:excisionase family DNA binding protein